MAAPALDERTRRHGARLLVRAAHVRDGRAQLAIDRHQGHADRVVLAQALVVGARNNAVHAVTHEEREVLALAVRSAHGIANENAVTGVGEGVLHLDGQLAEEGEGDSGNDEADRLRAHAVKGASQRVRAVAERLDRVGDVLLRLFREVPAVVENARHGRQAHSGQLGDVGQRGFAGTHARFLSFPRYFSSVIGEAEGSLASRRRGRSRHCAVASSRLAGEFVVAWFFGIYGGDVSHVTVRDIGFYAGI